MWFCELNDEGTSELRNNFTVMLVKPNCSFPYTYNGGLYYNCIENMQEISTTGKALGCVNFAAVLVVCNSPGR